MNFPIKTDPLRQSLAFALSAAAHGAAAFALFAYSGALPGTAQKERHVNRPLTVYLQQTDAVAIADESTTRQQAGGEAADSPLSGELPQTPQESAEPPAFPLPPQAETRYFRLSELSERPSVLQDIPSDLGLGFADVPPQTVILRLFINEEGGIDRVAAEESYLPADRMDLLVDTFSKVRFHPGIRDNIPVKSQMRIAVRLDSLLAAP